MRALELVDNTRHMSWVEGNHMTGMHIAFQLVSQDTKTPNAVLQIQLVTAAVNSGLLTQSLATM